MKKLTKVLVAILAITVMAPMAVEAKKEKKKKDKKKYEWKMPDQLSGNETIDTYLLSCDTLWNDIQKYNESMTTYIFKTDTFAVNGEIYVMSHMENAQGEYLTRAAANWQLVEAITLGVDIVADGVDIGLQTATATLALPELGLGALSYGKYVKAGPNIIALAGKEIKELASIRRAQWQQWKAMKEGAIDASTLGIWTPEQVEVLQKSCFIKKYEGDTALISEELAKQKAEQVIAQEITLAPEEEAQKLDEMPDDLPEIE